MSLRLVKTIEIPGAADSSFDHGAFDPKTRRVFIAHTARNCVEMINHDNGKHIATLPGFSEAAGVVAAEGMVLITNRGSASLAWIDAATLETQAVFKTGARPNGVALVPQQGLAIAACIGDDTQLPTLQTFRLDGSEEYSFQLPGRPRWCVTDAAAQQVFLAIRDPSMVLVAHLPELAKIEQWMLPAGGAHGMDIDHAMGRLYVACDDRALVELDIASGNVTQQWQISGVPDATFFNLATGLVHVAIGTPAMVDRWSLELERLQDL